MGKISEIYRFFRENLTPELKSGEVAPVKGLRKKKIRGVAHLPFFSPIRTVVADLSSILKDDTINKERGSNLR